MAAPKIMGNPNMEKMAGAAKNLGSKKKRRSRRSSSDLGERIFKRERPGAMKARRAKNASPDLGERIFKRRRPTRG